MTTLCAAHSVGGQERDQELLDALLAEFESYEGKPMSIVDEHSAMDIFQAMDSQDELAQVDQPKSPQRSKPEKPASNTSALVSSADGGLERTYTSGGTDITDTEVEYASPLCTQVLMVCLCAIRLAVT